MELKIATRKSPLALWQAEFVQKALQRQYPNLKVSLLGMTTKGDQLLNSPLSKLGGKGLFIKELEVALLEGKADIAVHSMKDVPMSAHLPQGLSVPVILEREDPRDAFVSNLYKSIEDLPNHAVVGTCSLRRKVQLLRQRPDLEIKDLRGNVNSRLHKLDDKQYDAIILAAAGLKRLGYEDRIKQFISQDYSLPAVGQGAIGIECRSDDFKTRELIAFLNDEKTSNCIAAERAFNARLNGGCQAPIAGFAEILDQKLYMHGLVGDLDSNLILEAHIEGSVEEAQSLGQSLADDLLAQGAGEILKKIYG